MKKLFLFSAIIINTLSVFSQPAFYERIYSEGRGNSIDHALNGNYIIGASIDTGSSKQGYFFLINEFGDTIQTFLNNSSTVNQIHQLPDSGFIFIGDTCCLLRAELMRIDKFGNTIWNKTYETDQSGSRGIAAYKNNLGGYYIAYYDNGGTSFNPTYVYRLDSMGNTIDSVITNDDSSGLINEGSMIPTRDSGVIITSTGGNFVYTIIDKVDTSCDIEWENGIIDSTGAIEYYSMSITQTSNNNFVNVGYRYDTNIGSTEGVIARFDSSGNILWTKIINIQNNFTKLISVQELTSGEFYVTGELFDTVSHQKSLMLMKTTSIGDTIWTRTFSGLGNATPNSLTQDVNQNPIILGYTYATGGADYIYLIKTDTMGNIITGTNKTEEEFTNIFPNPALNSIAIQFSVNGNKNGKALILDELGREIKTFEINKSVEIVSLENFIPGIYFLRIKSNSGIMTKRFIKM